MRRIINGTTHEIPEEPDGTIDVEVLRAEFGLDRNTTMLEVSPTRRNQILPKRGSVRLEPGSELMSAPILKRGT